MNSFKSDISYLSHILTKRRALILILTVLFCVSIYLNLRHYDLSYEREELYRISTEIRFTPERVYNKRDNIVIYENIRPIFKKIIQRDPFKDVDMRLVDLSRRKKNKLDGHVEFYGLYSYATKAQVEKTEHLHNAAVEEFLDFLPPKRFSVSEDKLSFILPGKGQLKQRSLLIIIPLAAISLLLSLICALFIESLRSLNLFSVRSRK